MRRFEIVVVGLMSAFVFTLGYGTGKTVYNHPACRPSAPPPMAKLECQVQEGANVSLFACTNKSMNDFAACVEQMQDWMETTYEGCK